MSPGMASGEPKVCMGNSTGPVELKIREQAGIKLDQSLGASLEEVLNERPR